MLRHRTEQSFCTTTGETTLHPSTRRIRPTPTLWRRIAFFTVTTASDRQHRRRTISRRTRTNLISNCKTATATRQMNVRLLLPRCIPLPPRCIHTPTATSPHDHHALSDTLRCPLFTGALCSIAIRSHSHVASLLLSEPLCFAFRSQRPRPPEHISWEPCSPLPETTKPS